MAVKDQNITDRWAIYNADSNETLPMLPDKSIHLSIYSPPFFIPNNGGNVALYNYSSDDRDLSNARTYDEAWEQYDFIIRQIARVTMPGRMSAVHCMPVPTGNTGCDSESDYPGDIIRQHLMCRNEKCTESWRIKQHGACGHGLFEKVAHYHIWKEPLGVRNRLMIKSLAHKTIVDDSSRCSNAAADQLLVFRRKGKNLIPIEHPVGLTEYAGEREIPADLLRYKGWTGNQIENRYSHWIWRQYASAFWDDIRIGRVLPYREARDSEDEKHVHCLQLDVIERCLQLWSNPGEKVLSPFMGVGSEVYGAVHAGRKGIGIELKPSYYRQAVKNLAEIDNAKFEEQLGMFAEQESEFPELELEVA